MVFEHWLLLYGCLGCTDPWLYLSHLEASALVQVRLVACTSYGSGVEMLFMNIPSSLDIAQAVSGTSEKS